MPTPRADSYSAASGAAIYAGRAAPATSFDARIIIAGQSNAVGRALRSEIYSSPLSSDTDLALYDTSATFARVKIWNSSQNAYIPFQPSVWRGMGVFPNQFGTELALALRWMRETTAGTLHLFKVAEGGISITEFAPVGSTMYPYFTTEKNWRVSNGFSVAQHALLWIQGEADAAQTQSWYQTRLQALLDTMATDSVLPSGAKVLLTQMAPDSSSYSSAVAAAKTAIAAASPSNISTLVMPYHDGLHMVGRGVVQHGYDAYARFYGGSQINV